MDGGLMKDAARGFIRAFGYEDDGSGIQKGTISDEQLRLLTELTKARKAQAKITEQIEIYEGGLASGHIHPTFDVQDYLAYLHREDRRYSALIAELEQELSAHKGGK